MSQPQRIYLSPPDYRQQPLPASEQLSDIAWLEGRAAAFESALAVRLPGTHVAALSSGTAAIHLALILAGVGEGDTVLCQSMTFSASANPILYLKAVPVFIDSEPSSWNMDPELLEKAIKTELNKGRKPKAIIPVHIYGMPANMTAITSLASTYEIPVIEDAAEALGAVYNHKPCGSLGDIGVLSFNSNKIITTSGGGALTSCNEAIVRKARFLASQARDMAPYYQHSEVGYNYRMGNVNAAIGEGQLAMMAIRVQARRSNYQTYYQALADLPGISFQHEADTSVSNRWLTAILIDPQKSGGVTTDQVRKALKTQQIESRPLWKPMHMQPVFSTCPAYVNGVAGGLFSQGLCLPSGSALSEADLQRIIAAIRSSWEMVRRPSAVSHH
ncbi:MAG: DegT/DnrJ/EryC1/StrS family aminotransferase [Imperialibacter sp.]|uniref:DegT/DnrJ/EryC1/StrS family aminotransferase n=1 Tax=Imperialibacter sp. TaxID=2038411 RepID=UPI0032EED4D8